MTDMLRIAEEAAEQAKFSLVSIDLNTIVFTLINTLIIVLLYFFFLHKPVCKILDERAKTVNKDMDDAQKAKEEAAAVKADYEHRLETSKEEAARIVADATKKAQACAAYVLYTILNASWFPSFRALTKAWASSCEYFWDILIILNMKIKNLLY